MFAQTAHLQGPLSSHLLSHGDISALVGMAVGGALYWALCRTRTADVAESVAEERVLVAKP
jgi:hypothetical protein